MGTKCFWFYREPVESFLARGLKLGNFRTLRGFGEEENQKGNRDSFTPGDWEAGGTMGRGNQLHQRVCSVTMEAERQGFRETRQLA